MNSNSSPIRGYSEVLLEEIALEGLDGIALSTFWKRLNVNPEWVMKPIDSYVEDFIWKHLQSLSKIRWYKLSKPRENPPVFASLDEYLLAIDNKEIDPLKIGSKYYKYHEIKAEHEMGSCAEYETRIEITDQIQNCSLSAVRSKWADDLVIVADQEVRNYVLLSDNLHYDSDVLDISTYCILERIGRSRRCGELSISLNFIKNGANPTFYFWNKLRRKNLITSQTVFLKTKYSTLFYLKKFHEDVGKLATNLLGTIIKAIESSPKKACTLVELKEINPKIMKFMRYNSYREYLQVEKVPYSQHHTNSKKKELLGKNGKEKIVTVVKLIEKAETRKSLPKCDNIDGDDDDRNDENEENCGVLEETRFLNKPLLSQCFHIIDEAGINGISQVEVGRKMGLNKLLTRMLLKTLMKTNEIVSSGPEDAKKRFYKYYSKNFSYIRDKKMEQLSGVSELFRNDSFSKVEDNSETSMVIDEARKELEQILTDGNVEEDEELKKKETSQTENINEKIIELKGENLYTVRRVNIILEHVYKNQVELKTNLKQIIQTEEKKQGFFQGDLDRRSMNKILNLLVSHGKIKIITRNITEPTFNKSKEIVFICLPHVTEEHPAIKASIQQAQSSLSILYVKNAGSKKKEASDLDVLLYIGTKNTSKYGHAPKFVRMRVLHELLFYMLFSYEGDENLDYESYNSFIRSVCDDFAVGEKLPKCYLKAISWKMFIPPLMKYEEYKDGWVSQSDIIERIPLRLLFMLIRLPHEIPDLQEYLSHPIKQHYLVHDLPPDMQKIIRVDKQYLYLLGLTFRFLAMIGLIQYGPKLAYRGNVNLIYVNRKATLLDTRACSPGYSKINVNINYPIHRYELNTLSDVETYWSDAMRFALGTKLGCHKMIEETAQDTERLPERLKQTLTSCTIDEAPRRDTGIPPGDRQGALGFDSHLYAHLVRSWFFSRKRSTEPVTEKQETVASKKPKVVDEITTKKQVTKMKRFRFTPPRKTVSSKKNGKLTYDEADEMALRNMKTLRVQWTKAEDDLLMMTYLATLYSAQYLPNYRPVRIIRELMHESCKKSLDKTALACSRRIYRLIKDKIREHSLNVYLKELLRDPNLKDKCQDVLDKIEEIPGEKSSPELLSTLDKLTEIVFRHLRDNVKAAEITSSSVYETTLPDDIETFKKSCHYEYPGVTNVEKSFLLHTENDISILVIINLIFSSLLSQVDKKKKINTNFMHHTFRNFDDNRLKTALSYVRGHRLISFNKCNERSRSSYLPIGQGVYHLSLTFHLLLKTLYPVDVYNQIYARYLQVIGYQSHEFIDIKSYEAGLNLLLMSYFISNEVEFDVHFPESILFFDAKPLPLVNPEEIAKPMFEATNSFTDQTLSLIRESFFSTEKDGANSHDTSKNQPDSDSDTDLEFDKDDEVTNDSPHSKLTLFVTRRQFKQSEVRFSNAYDHFLINCFPLKYRVKNGATNCNLKLESDRENLIKTMEKECKFRKLKYSVDEMSSLIQKQLSKSRERDCASSVLDFLRQCGLCGATNHMLKSKFNDLHLLREVMDGLCKAKLVLRSGSKFTHYVHIEFAASWLVPCQKNVDLYMGDDAGDVGPIIINRNKMEKMQAQSSGQLWAHIKPWVHVNGALNREALDSLLVRIVSFCTKWPCSSLEQVQNKFSPAIQPHFTRELIEILERMKCVKISALSPPKEISLFSPPSWELDFDTATGFEDENLIIIETDVHVMTKLAIFLKNANYKDLLETTYSTGLPNLPRFPSYWRNSKQISENNKMRVNGSLLGKYIDKNVSIIGTVHSVHLNNTAFNITSTDNHNVTINLSKPLSGNVSGLVEVRGIARGPATVACDYFIVFPHDLASTFDPVTDDEAVNLSFRLPNPWK